MAYKPYPPPGPLLEPYDPGKEIPKKDHARLIELIVNGEDEITDNERDPDEATCDPSILLKVLLYGYSSGEKSTRDIAYNCRLHLGYLFLTRGEKPSYGMLRSFRDENLELLFEYWILMCEGSASRGRSSFGKFSINRKKFTVEGGNCSIDENYYNVIRTEFTKIVVEAIVIDNYEDQTSADGSRPEFKVDPGNMREIYQHVKTALSDNYETD